MFDKFWKKTAAARLIEEQFYEQVVHELRQGRKRDGLWAKALVNSEGSEQKAKSLYIEYRVQSIKDELQVSAALAEEAKNTTAVEYQRRVNKCMLALRSKGCQFISRKTGHGWIVSKPSGSCELIETIEELEKLATGQHTRQSPFQIVK